MIKFFKNIKNKYNKFLKDSYKCIPKNYYKSPKNNFFIINNAILDFFWYKYNHQFECRSKNLYKNFT